MNRKTVEFDVDDLGKSLDTIALVLGELHKQHQYGTEQLFSDLKERYLRSIGYRMEAYAIYKSGYDMRAARALANPRPSFADICQGLAQVQPEIALPRMQPRKVPLDVSSKALVKPTKVFYSPKSRKTIVIWNDKTKTVVKCGDDQEYDEYTGFIAAYAKRMFGSTSHLKKLLAKVSTCSDKKVKEPDDIITAE